MENYIQNITTIDTHTMGEATRIVIDGFPEIIGKTMMDKKNYIRENFDYLRELLMNEPRGHKEMFGSIVTKPTSEKADFGVIFMDSGSYLNMCGHGTIGTVTMMITKGLVSKKDKIVIDTPSGLIECYVEYNNNQVQSVSFKNVPAFVRYKNELVKLSSGEEVSVDIAFGGSFFAIVQAKDLNIEIDVKNSNMIVSKAMELRTIINQNLTISHPENKNITTVDLIEITEKKAENHYKNVVVFGNGQIDRSPCGTGTCAKMALLDLEDGESIIQESIIGSTFVGTKIASTTVGDYPAIIPMIKGSAWITGEHKFVLQAHDIYETGFSI